MVPCYFVPSWWYRLEGEEVLLGVASLRVVPVDQMDDVHWKQYIMGKRADIKPVVQIEHIYKSSDDCCSDASIRVWV